MVNARTSRFSFSSISLDSLLVMARRFISQVAVLVLCFIAYGAPSALAEYFEIDHYSVVIRVSETAVLDVEETLDVRFLSPRHGIFREIPFEYKSNGLTGTYVTRIYDLEVPGERFSTETKGANLSIKIGDPDRFVSGTHRYTIRYKVFGAVQFFDGFSELYWNAIGLAWPVPVRRVFVQVVPPRLLAH